jgi:putative MATE family efflux protein
MFLSVATSNLIATSIAEKDPEGAARSLSRALFIALVCGVAITIICETLHTPLLRAFVGKNVKLIPAARVYVQIRGLAWPAVLATMVAQSACLGMQDAWGPLRVLAVAASVNCLGDILLCSVFKMGIAGAAWATAASQIVGCVLMVQSLRKRSTIPLYLSVPRIKDLVVFMAIAGPTLITMLSKVSFYTLMTFVCTAHGTATGAGHQVMIGLYAFFAVFAEPLCQTAQSFIPEFIRGANRSLHKARKLLLSLMVMGGLQGLVLGAGAGLMPWILPQLFTSDPAVVDQMRRSSFQIFAACTISGMNLSMEGTLLAGRDLIYLAISMVISFSIGASALLMGSKRNMGLGGIWWCLVGFQALRFISASFRLSHPKSVVGGLRTRSKGVGHVPVVFGK